MSNWETTRRRVRAILGFQSGGPVESGRVALMGESCSDYVVPRERAATLNLAPVASKLSAAECERAFSAPDFLEKINEVILRTARGPLQRALLVDALANINQRIKVVPLEDVVNIDQDILDDGSLTPREKIVAQADRLTLRKRQAFRDALHRMLDDLDTRASQHG